VESPRSLLELSTLAVDVNGLFTVLDGGLDLIVVSNEEARLRDKANIQ
jgi:hypothetical protein